MELIYNPDTPDGAEITITVSKRERDLLGEDLGLPILLRNAMDAIIALRSGERPAGDSTEAGNWTAFIHGTAQLNRILAGVLDGEIRAHAAAKGSYGQLARALGVPRSTAQTRRDALLAKAPDQWEPVPATEALS